MVRKKINDNPGEPESPRPTRAAFIPASAKDVRNDILAGLFFLAAFGLGLLVNRTTDFFSFSAGLDFSSSTSSPPSILLQLLFFFGFPLFIPAGIFFLYEAWHSHRKAAAFWRDCQSGEAVVTHLWKEPPSGSGKKYYAGYSGPYDAAAFQQVDVWTFKRLQVGDTLPLKFLPEQPDVSFLDLPRARIGNKKAS